MWTYKISTGVSRENDTARHEISYSGHGQFKNDPTKCHIPMEGPIPPGKYRLGHSYHHDHLGPVVMNLEPLPGTDTFGRSLFRVHGDSISAPGTASHGCIVAPRSLREAMDKSNDRILEVIA